MNSEELTLVLKTVERCNINCTYCYFFHGGDSSWKKHPPYINSVVLDQLVEFLSQAIIDLNLRKINIGFHGGEPMMQKVTEFDSFCESIRMRLEPQVEVAFTIQTNGTLVTEEWIHCFIKYNVFVGVSIDGPKDYNDVYRLTKQGQSTHEKVESGIEKLLSHCEFKDKFGSIGALTVINPEFDAAVIYRYLVDDLGLTTFDFLLPDFTHDVPLPYPPEAYGAYLSVLYQEWKKDANPNIVIRYLNSAIDSFKGGYSSIYGVGSNPMDTLPLITISSNGDLGPVDELRVTQIAKPHKEYNIYNVSLKDYFQDDLFTEITQSQKLPPKDCSDCCWQRICHGGNLVNRYSTLNKFDNRSVYCQGLIEFNSTVATDILKTGYPLDTLTRTLGITGH